MSGFGWLLLLLVLSVAALIAALKRKKKLKEHGFVDEPQESELVTSAASNCESLHPIRIGDEWPEHSLGDGCAFQINEITKREDTLAQLSRDLRKALFVGGCGPRNKTARA